MPQNGKQARKGADLAARTRGAILNAFDRLEREGETLSEALARAFKDNPLQFMSVVAKYLPKDVNIEHRTSDITADDLSNDELAAIVAEKARKLRQEKQSQDTELPIAVNK